MHQSRVRGRRVRADDRGRRAAARCLCVFEYISVFHYFIYIKTSIAPVELTLVLLKDPNWLVGLFKLTQSRRKKREAPVFESFILLRKEYESKACPACRAI